VFHVFASSSFKSVSMAPGGIVQLSESMRKVSKFRLSSDTSASTKSSMVGCLCSIPVTHTHQAAGFKGKCVCMSVCVCVCLMHICLWEGKNNLAGHCDELVFSFHSSRLILTGKVPLSATFKLLRSLQRLYSREQLEVKTTTFLRKSFEARAIFFYPQI